MLKEGIGNAVPGNEACEKCYSKYSPDSEDIWNSGPSDGPTMILMPCSFMTLSILSLRLMRFPNSEISLYRLSDISYVLTSRKLSQWFGASMLGSGHATVESKRLAKSCWLGLDQKVD